MTNNDQVTDKGILLLESIKSWGKSLGFWDVGVSHIRLDSAERRLLTWLDRDYHGEMAYMSKHGLKRSRPDLLFPGTVSVICASLPYLNRETNDPLELLQQTDKAYISRYALGRDYHKVLRKKLLQLARRIEQEVGQFQYRVFTDSAPVMEKPLAHQAGLGWIGKHSNLLSRQGSWFFLGEIYSDLPLPCAETPPQDHCGRCRACMDACPTGAIVEPYVVDARLCISYLTIELKGSIPAQLRPYIGNRIYGCDDCQLVCPWNRFSPVTGETDFKPRHGLDKRTLLELFQWSEAKFLQKTEGMAVRRISHDQWLRNIAVALGNSPPHPDVIVALRTRRETASPMVREHIEWALDRQQVNE